MQRIKALPHDIVIKEEKEKNRIRWLWKTNGRCAALKAQQPNIDEDELLYEFSI